MPDDPEARCCVVLTKQGYPVDRERRKADCGETIPQHRHHVLAAFGGKPPGQRHVEAKFFHDVRITPAIEIIALPRRQLGRISPRAILRRERRAERIERTGTVGRKPFDVG